MIGLATHETIREAIDAAKQGTPSMLEASAKMSVEEAQQVAAVLLLGQADEGVTTYTKGPWLHVEPSRLGQEQATDEGMAEA